MTITTASKSNAETIKVIPKRHKFFVYMENEKRVVLTRGRAIELLAELDAIGELDRQHTLEAFERSAEVADDEVIPYEERPAYAVSIFSKLHGAQDLRMLEAWLRDALFGWSHPVYREVTSLKRTRKATAEIFALMG